MWVRGGAKTIDIETSSSQTTLFLQIPSISFGENSAFLQFIHISLAVPVPISAPLSPYSVAKSPTIVDIVWLPPRAIDINGQIDFYIVELTEIVTGQLMIFHAVEDHIIVPVRTGYAYRCRVAAHTVDQGPFTDYFIVRSQELGMM